MKKIKKFFATASGYTGDGRKPIRDLYNSFSTLKEAGWIEEMVAISRRNRDGKNIALPILSYRTPNPGKNSALWIIGGIHGEEPAGPNAIADGIAHIRELGAKTPVVLLPLCNPLGYYSNWRYLNMPEWKPDKIGFSVGDSEHFLPSLNNPSVSRAEKSSSRESKALASYILNLASDYPPLLSIDLHEDNLIHEGYIYTQGSADDPVACKIVDIISAAGIAIKKDGKTRFGEDIDGGIVSHMAGDGSIDELMGRPVAIAKGVMVPGPNAKTVIVVETPAGALPLESRKKVHLEILKNLGAFLKSAPG